MFSGRKAKADDFSLPSQKHKYRSVTAASFCASCSYTLKIEALKIFCSAGRLYLPPRSGKQARTGVWISLAHLQLSTAESTLCCLKGAGAKAASVWGELANSLVRKGELKALRPFSPSPLHTGGSRRFPGPRLFSLCSSYVPLQCWVRRDLSCVTAGWPCVRLWHPHQGLL